MSAQHPVYKTLLIGVGSTGTRIVERLMSKVEWELGSIEKAPWIKYLALETDVDEFAKNPLLRRRVSDTYHLGISESDFAHIRSSIRTGEPNSINVGQWADSETIAKLPDNLVKSGVGNIRMIGRLAFLHRPNFEDIKSRVINRLDYLRDLDALTATEIRGPLASGKNPTVEFANPGVQVYVVGALAGGTASGCASDVGFFLRTLARGGDTVTGIFTVPRPTLTAAISKHAERLKKNAYSALVELNHYHLGNRIDENPIVFADGTSASKDTFPYDLTYVLMPKEDGASGEGNVNQAVADRLFLSIFAPQTNTAGEAVNATPFAGGDNTSDFSDRDHRAHVFCTFGLSVVDFPVQRVVEACQTRLLSRALADKLVAAVDDAAVDDLVTEMGLTWDTLTEDLFADDGELDNFINTELRSIRDAAAADRHKAADRFTKFRRSFGQPGEAGSELGDAGGVTRYLRDRRTAVVRRALARVQTVVAKAIGDPNIGLRTLASAISKAVEFIGELESSSRASTQATPDLSDAFARVEGYNSHALLALLLLKGAASKRARDELDSELRTVAGHLKRQGAANALTDGGKFQGDVGAVSILADLGVKLGRSKTRVEELIKRIQEQQRLTSGQASRIESADPENGVTLFEGGNENSGTVGKAYRQRLGEEVSGTGRTWEQAEFIHKRLVLQALAEVAPAVTSEKPEWLDRSYSFGSGDAPIDSELAAKLNDRAFTPFKPIEDTEVVTLLEELPDSERAAKIESAAVASRPFLQINEELAMRGGRSPIASKAFAILPSSTGSADIWPLVQSKMASNVEEKTGHQPHRIVLIHELYRFPLSGVPTIVGAEGVGISLSDARCTDFPTFWSRKDVAWTGVSDSEIMAIRRAEEALATALLTHVATVADGHVIIPGERGFGQDSYRYLPARFKDAVRLLADGGRDARGAPLTGGPSHLEGSIVAELQNRYSAAPVSNEVGSGAHTHESSYQHPNTGFAKYAVATLDNALKGNFNSPLLGAPTGPDLISLIHRFVARRNDWFKELDTLHGISESQRNLTFRHRGELKGNGYPAEEDGFYCPTDGSLIGRTEQEATLNGWRCYAYPDQHRRDNSWGTA